MAYIASSDVKNYGGWAATDAGDDALIDALIPVAQKMTDSYCNRVFEYDSDAPSTRYYDAIADIRDDTLLLDKDLNVAVSIKVDGQAIDTDSYVTEPRSDAPYWGITIYPSSSDSWDYGTDSQNAISISGLWSYSSSAPDDIRQANILLVQWLTKMRNSDLALTAPIIDASAGVTIMPVQMPNVVKQILNLYKRITFEVV